MRPPLQRPIRYRVEKQKIAAWKLELVGGSVVILGDSNLSRIPEYDCPWVEIHSLPGAQLHHLGGLIKKLGPHPLVQKVVLAVGLNNCLRLNEVTTIKKQLQQLTAGVHKKFPVAEIFVPLIQYSDHLPSAAQYRLDQFNNIVRNGYRFLEGIEGGLFRVDRRDPVH